MAVKYVEERNHKVYLWVELRLLVSVAHLFL